MISALDDAGYRLTGRRREVAELIAAREGHFTAADLILDAQSRRLGIGREIPTDWFLQDIRD